MQIRSRRRVDRRTFSETQIGMNRFRAILHPTDAFLVMLVDDVLVGLRANIRGRVDAARVKNIDILSRHIVRNGQHFVQVFQITIVSLVVRIGIGTAVKENGVVIARNGVISVDGNAKVGIIVREPPGQGEARFGFRVVQHLAEVPTANIGAGRVECGNVNRNVPAFFLRGNDQIRVAFKVGRVDVDKVRVRQDDDAGINRQRRAHPGDREVNRRLFRRGDRQRAEILRVDRNVNPVAQFDRRHALRRSNVNKVVLRRRRGEVGGLLKRGVRQLGQLDNIDFASVGRKANFRIRVPQRVVFERRNAQERAVFQTLHMQATRFRRLRFSV